MEFKALIICLRTILPVSSQLDSEIREKARKILLKKGEIIHSPGTRIDQIWYIAKGLIKEYYEDKVSEKEVITAFWKENEFMILTDSYYRKNQPAGFIKIIEDSILLTIDSKQAQKIRSLYPETQSLECAIINAAKEKDYDKMELVNLSANERNNRFCEKQPYRRISVNDAAAYLGLSRETVSMIRSRNARNPDTEK